MEETDTPSVETTDTKENTNLDVADTDRMENVDETDETAKNLNPPQKWNGVQLANEAEIDQEIELVNGVDGDEDEDDDDDDDYEDEESLAQQEKILEELLRLRLSAQPEATASQLPPKQRIQLYQPRTKLEQFEDILMESQLLETTGLSSKLDEMLSGPSDAPTSCENLDYLRDYDVIGLDFDASDAIFNETVPLKSVAKPPPPPGSDAPEPCRCSSCQERLDIESEQHQEVERLRNCWSELRKDVSTLYRMVWDGTWNDGKMERPDLGQTKERVHKLCWRDPHQLYQRLEAGVKEFVLEVKVKLYELLQKQAKNPSLAQDFIQGRKPPYFS